MIKTPTGKFIECKHCNKHFYIPKYRFDKSKYCSLKCKGLYERQEIKAKCSICDTEFVHISSRCNKAKYCSRSCYYRSLKGKGSVKFNCKNCNKEMNSSPSKTRVYCSIECRAIHGKIKWTKSVSISYARSRMKEEGLLQKCIICGLDSNPEILGIHHKDRNRRNNSKSNLVCMCPNCHSIEHGRHIIHS